MKFGIDLGGSHISIGLVDDDCNIVEKRSYYMNDRKDKSLEHYIIESIVSGINEILTSSKISFSQIDKIGIASPGNAKNGRIGNVVNLGIKEICIEEELRRAFGTSIKNVSIKIENDGKCAGIAEKFCGSLKEYDDCVFLCIGTGIGGAVFMDGKFLRPKRNSGFEFGHMMIGKDDECRCKCGNIGCFEVYCSKMKFKSQVQKILGIDGYVSAKELTERIMANIHNDEIRVLLEDYIKNLTVGVANIVNIFEPEAICIGGSMSHYDSLILEKLRSNIQRGEYLFNKENPPKILVAQAGNDAGIIGATLI